MAATEPRGGLEGAALALRRGDPLTAMNLTDRDASALALAIRGAALAQLDESAAATTCLASAAKQARKAGDRETALRAELALAEIRLATRDLARAAVGLDACATQLAVDDDNHTLVAALRSRLEILRGRPAEATTHLDGARPRDAFGMALIELARAEAEIAIGDAAGCEAAVDRGAQHARAARHGFLLAEIEHGRERLHKPIAVLDDAGRTREVSLLDVARVRARRDVVVVDELRRTIHVGGSVLKLAARPQLFAIVKRLAAAFPDVVPRDELVLALGVRRANEAHRATLRVELARLRGVLPDGIRVETAEGGWRLAPAAPLLRVAPRPGERVSDVEALLSDGMRWRADDVARALGTSPRSAQRNLAELRDAGAVRSVGAGPAVRWIRDGGGFTLLGQLSALWAAGA